MHFNPHGKTFYSGNWRGPPHYFHLLPVCRVITPWVSSLNDNTNNTPAKSGCFCDKQMYLSSLAANSSLWLLEHTCTKHVYVCTYIVLYIGVPLKLRFFLLLLLRKSYSVYAVIWVTTHLHGNILMTSLLQYSSRQTAQLSTSWEPCARTTTVSTP